MIRIGHGFDLHRYEENDTPGVLLAGVLIPYALGVAAHSDGDVLVHAVIDALLGALALGDIGQWFPDTSSDCKDISSFDMLEKVMSEVKARNFTIGNIDATVIAQRPKLQNYIEEMRVKLAAELDISYEQVSIKAKTHEKVDAIGQEKAIAAHVVVLLTC